ncbi:hypothetical protein SDRG_12668 [Saprolegnia diclina VS20]|uniref:E3 ubiquitin-protein ligase HACE1 n=1 Tax=Saprolegnia diclina (strain VS20) TaxID=1156394 RepID=T0PVX2_SAPDV|nr:hypothetical protein SDRG_12668 [Saprolegnia diclina VS20]EQC29664.1 hypothetical protein SDRG_12668 [Saprolegnia diclina VS20]|eukprot:XP_008616968.1 hypothetical protein SDRG_12668 [Saprolegnia diclina VS20]
MDAPRDNAGSHRKPRRGRRGKPPAAPAPTRPDLHAGQDDATTVASTQLTSAVRRRDISVIAAILTVDPELANSRDESGRTALTTLCANAGAYDVCNIADVLLSRGALINCNDGRQDGPLHLASCGTNAALLTKLLEAAKAQEAPTPHYGDLLLAALFALAEASPLQKMTRPTKKKTNECQLDAKGPMEALVDLEAKHWPVIQVLVEASERDTRVPPDALWATLATHQTTALHVACRELLPTVVSLLLSHSFLPSVLDARNVSAVHALEDTLLKVQSALAPTKKKPSGLDALPTHVDTQLGMRTVGVLGAFGEKVGYDKLFQHAGPYAVHSRWAKNFLVAAKGIEYLYAKLATEVTPRAMLPFLSHVGGLHRLTKQPASPFATWAWRQALQDQRHLFKKASLYGHLLAQLLHTDTSASVLHTWTFVLQDMVAASTLSRFLKDLTAVILQSAMTLIFQLQTEAYELDETELMRLVLARFEMLLVLGSANPELATLLKPLDVLQQLLTHVLLAVRHVQDYPERFLGALYLVQLQQQVRATDASTLREMAATHGRKANRPGSFLKRMAESLPLPALFLSWLTPFRRPLNVLLMSEAALLRQYVHREAWHLVDLETKVAYFGADASARGTDLRIHVNRQTPQGLVTEFIVQQVLSTPVRHLWGDMTVEFTHEPGAGVGPLREFFELVRRAFLDPQVDLSPDGRVEASATQHIGSAWLRLARRDASSDAAPRSLPTPLTAWFPLVAYMGSSSLLRIAPRPKRTLSPPKDVGNHVLQVAFASIEAMAKGSDVYKLYRCLGRLFGLAVRHGIVLGARFPLVFWQVLMEAPTVQWTDLVSDDPALRRSLEATLAHDFATPWDLTFEMCDHVEYNGAMLTAQVELQPRGFETPVTNDNKEAYVLALAMHHFCSNRDALDAVRVGLYDVVPKREIALLRPDELQRVLAGDQALDMAALQAHVTYGRHGSAEHPTIRHFWAVVDGMAEPTQRELLVFWSGSSLPPLFGFAHADEVVWSIDVVAVPDGKTPPLPQAHTCDRKIVLPAYATQDELATKLALALEFGTFGYDRI